MERIFPFLHEDVLYLINDYAKDNINKKELCNEIFSEFLALNLMKVNIRYQWVLLVISMNFKNINQFLEFLEIANSDFSDINNNGIPIALEENNRIIYYSKDTINKLVEYYKIPIGPRLKIYHYFVKNYRFNKSNVNRDLEFMEERVIDMMMDAII